MAAEAGYVARLEISVDNVLFHDLAPWVDGTLNVSVDALQITAHQNNGARSYIPGHHDGTMDYTLVRDEAENGQTLMRQGVIGGTKTNFYWKIFPTVQSGANLYTARGFATGLNESFNRDDAQEVSGQIQLSDLALTTQP